MTAVLHELRTESILRSVEIAKRQETRDAWELADAIYEDVADEMGEKFVPTNFSSGRDSGLEVAIEGVYDAHRKAGTDVGRTYVKAMFATVRVWPPEDRLPELASFVVHAELRGKDYPNRREVIQRLAANSKTGRATWVNLRRWKSERKPQQARSFLELADQRIRRTVNDAGKPWHKVADGDRVAIVQILRQIADEVEAGTFGIQA
jgi:hypothetical protein